MADWKDILEGISGGAFGITKGLTAGAEPFNAWEKVRTQDLANDKSDIQLRDLLRMQDALESTDNYYGNAASAKDVANRKAIASGNLDIFGSQRELSMQDYLASPAFQEEVSRLDPSDPEYRSKVAAAIAQYNPQKGITSYDAFGVDKMQNKNLQEQAALQYLQSYVQKTDPNAQVIRLADGTAAVLGSNGELTPVPGELVTKLAAMVQAPTPLDAVYKGLKSEEGIQGSNIKLLEALQKGQIAPRDALKILDQQRIQLGQSYQGALRELSQLTQSQDYRQADDDAKLQMTQELRARVTKLKQAMDQQQKIYSHIAATNSIPRLGGDAPSLEGPSPTGGTTVTTRPPLADIAARAAGQPSGSLWGQSSEGPAYPPRRASPQNTGVRAITQPPNDPLGAFLESIGAL